MLNQEIIKDKEYYNIVSKYLEDEKVQSLANIPHHDSNRLNHCLKISYKSYEFCKKHNLNYESAAKAGLLHDFYFNRTTDYNRAIDKVRLFSNGHSEDSLKNAEDIFYLSPLEKNIIISHMWPASTHIPKHKESFVVNIIDKYCSIKEFKTKINYNLAYKIGLYVVLFLNFIRR